MRSYQNFEFPYPLIISEVPEDLSVIVVIPAYYEPEINKTLASLINNHNFNGSAEVIIIINESDNSSGLVSEFHESQYEYLKNWSKLNSSDKLKFFPVYIKNIKSKDAGVGIARKIGMDEAYKRFLSGKMGNGIIACLDADTYVAENYLQTLVNKADKKNNTKAYSIYFEHDLGAIEDSIILESIIDYELHLRYYINMQRLIGLPYAYYTVGSAMAVKAYAYGEVFGMNKRQAGEDFYFLHKFTKTGHLDEINNTKVFPSARISDRVPFGTGKTILNNYDNNNELLTYDFRSFDALLSMIENIDKAYFDSKGFLISLSEPVSAFLDTINVMEKLDEIRKNTTSVNAFIKRYYAWFDAFQLMKYMHFSRKVYFEDIPVSDAIHHIAKKLKISDKKSRIEYLDELRSRDQNY